MSTALRARPVLVYAGHCKFCCASARFVARLDTEERLAFLPLADPECDAVLPGMSMESRRESWHLVMTDGSQLRGGEGLIVLMELLRPVRRLGRLMATLRAAPLLTLFDRVLKGVRRRLSRLMSDEPGPRRFP